MQAMLARCGRLGLPDIACTWFMTMLASAGRAHLVLAQVPGPAREVWLDQLWPLRTLPCVLGSTLCIVELRPHYNKLYPKDVMSELDKKYLEIGEGVSAETTVRTLLWLSFSPSSHSVVITRRDVYSK